MIAGEVGGSGGMQDKEQTAQARFYGFCQKARFQRVHRQLYALRPDNEVGIQVWKFCLEAEFAQIKNKRLFTPGSRYESFPSQFTQLRSDVISKVEISSLL